MNRMLSREPVGQGVFFSSVSDPKFKHNRISVRWIMPLEEESASANALVPFLLRKGCRSCPDFTQLEERLCGLYGASLGADTSKFGGYQMMGVWIQSIDNRFAIDGMDIAGESARLLADIAFDPKMGEDGLFDAKDFQLEKTFLLDAIASEINDKRGYAISRCVELMCAGEPQAIRRYGTLEQAKGVTPQDAARAYNRMMKEASIEILFVGCGDPAPIKELFRGIFQGKERSAVDYLPCPRKERGGEPRETVEPMEVAQGKLVLGLRTGPAIPQQENGPMRMMAALLGGTPSSLLFANVREKMSLCYYCAARYDTVTGLMLIDSGIEGANKQAACDAILAQLEAVQKGDFADDVLEATRLAMVNALRTTGDSLGGIESWYLSQILQGEEAAPVEEIAKFQKVTREEVVEAANQVTLDTIYFLAPAGQKEEACHE